MYYQLYEDESDQMVIGQHENDELINQRHQIDLDKIYEFNDNEFENDRELSKGLQLNRTSKAQLNQLIRNDEHLCSFDVSTDISNESFDEYFPSYANLNDYVLFDIFSLLSLIEQCMCRLVCKRWKFLIDQIRIKKLSLTYFSKYSWSSNENYNNLKQYSDSIEVSSLDSFNQILIKQQFKDLEHLILGTEYASNIESSIESNSELFELDVSKFSKLKKLEIFGSRIQLKENQVQCLTLTCLSIENLNEINICSIFPNLIYLKTDVLYSNMSSSKLRHLEYFTLEKPHTVLENEKLFKAFPNLRILACYFLDAFNFLSIENFESFSYKNLEKIQIYSLTFSCYEFMIDLAIQMASNLKIKLEFHITENPNQTRGELIKCIKFFQNRQISTVYFGQRKVNLKDFFLLPNYENNTLLKQNLKLDKHSLENINDQVYQYLFNTNSLELNSDNLEDKFNFLIRTMPCITKLTINYRLSQQTFDRFKFYCPYLSHLKINSSKQSYKLDLNFIHYLDHLTSLDLTNIDLINCSTIQNKVKFSKFLHILQFRNCRLLDVDYCKIAKAMVEKAKKNQGKFYEIHIWPVQQDHIVQFNDQFNNASENFYTNIFRFQP